MEHIQKIEKRKQSLQGAIQDIEKELKEPNTSIIKYIIYFNTLCEMKARVKELENVLSLLKTGNSEYYSKY